MQSLEREVRELKRADRMHALYEKNAKSQLARLGEMQRRLVDKDQEVLQHHMRCQELERSASVILDDLELAKREIDRLNRARQEMEASNRSLRQQVVDLRLVQQRELFRQGFGSMRSVPGPNHVHNAMELVKRLQKEVHRGSKAAEITERLVGELAAEAEVRKEMTHREAHMRRMLEDRTQP